MMKLGELLSTPTINLGRAGRFVVFQVKLWSHCARLLRINRAGQVAAALSYQTIFGIIPLAIVMILIFRLFPEYSDIGQKVKNLIYSELRLTSIEYREDANTSSLLPSLQPVDANTVENAGSNSGGKTIMLTEYLDKIVAGFFIGVNAGSVTLVSILIVLWAALALLSTIEKAFNHIWHVAKGRNILQRMINYWAILTLGPILLGIGVYVTTQNPTFTRLEEGNVLVQELLSYFISLIAFFLLYYVLPNTKVHTSVAVWGAAVAAVVWAFAKWGFSSYVLKFIPYNQVYGVLGLIPLSVFWIYVSWLIVLFGLQVTYTTQHFNILDADAIKEAKEAQEYFIANDFTAINIIKVIAAAFKHNQAPVDTAFISSTLNIPAEFAEKILNHFVNSGIIVRTSEPKPGYMPARDPAMIKLSDIAEALDAAGLAQASIDQSDGLKQIVQNRHDDLAKYSLEQILGK